MFLDKTKHKATRYRETVIYVIAIIKNQILELAFLKFI